MITRQSTEHRVHALSLQNNNLPLIHNGQSPLVRFGVAVAVSAYHGS